LDVKLDVFPPQNWCSFFLGFSFIQSPAFSKIQEETVVENGNADVADSFHLILKSHIYPISMDLIWDKQPIFDAPAGIWTRVVGSKGRYAWPDYTTGART